jgi:hypothetical protein
MADFVFNIAKGRVAELFDRVDNNDPPAAILVVIPVSVAAVTDATLIDVDDFAGVITAGVTELTTGGWNRKTLADTDIATQAPTDASDFNARDIADQTWTAVSAGTSTDLIICYSAVASPTNSQLVPLTQHDFAITPDGSDVTAQINAAGFFKAA